MILTFVQAVEYAMQLHSQGYEILSIHQFADPDAETHIPEQWYVIAQDFPNRQYVSTRWDEFTDIEPPRQCSGKTVICQQCGTAWPETTYKRHLAAHANHTQPISRCC